MSEFETIREIARKTLTAQTPSGDWLWDRSCRIRRNVDQISRLPGPAGKAKAIDRPCLITAAYFAESGYTQRSAGAKSSGAETLWDMNDDNLFSASTRIVTKQLTNILNNAQIEKINTIITESVNRFTTMTEAMILSDARNLEDLGSVGLLHELRRMMLQGKSVSDLLDSWERKIEYGYWQARIKESFRFDAVRQIAEQRLATATAFMEQVAIENNATDLEQKVLKLSRKS